MMLDSQFFAAVSIWIEKPQSVNQHLFGAKILGSYGSNFKRIVYPKIRTNVLEFEETITECENSYFFSSDFAKYSIQKKDSDILVTSLNDHGSNLMSSDWLKGVLEKKLNSWFHSKLTLSKSSLTLIDMREYQDTYKTLKDKYGKYILDVWTERTNPCKFVYEDIGIACYLKCLWKDDKKIRFVDVGCGNGLLVYLLISEGFTGVGVDVRRRGIWKMYPPFVQECLQEVTLQPEDSSGFPKANWLIGNHSDELTPWIPILATKSGSTCRVFVLPCCPFSLFGKYNGNVPSALDSLPEMCIRPTNNSQPKSRYSVYLRYLQDLCCTCGFRVESDVLRIPSTKRICIIGRTFIEKNHEIRLNKIKNLVESERDMNPRSCKNFIPRPKTETVLNCSSVPQETYIRICKLIFDKLISVKPNENELYSENLVVSNELKIKTLDGRWWNPGGKLNLQDINQLLTPDDRKFLKSQHGGLQTLIRNNHQAFRTVHGTVQLRWSCANFVHRNDQPQPIIKHLENRKTKICWMSEFHPDGCPYPTNLCDFAHESIDIINKNL